MKPVNIFDTYSKWFKLLNALFIGDSIYRIIRHLIRNRPKN